MNLTEPQCGTDLGLIKTKAVPAEDGSFRITGQKIFISAGEHDLTSNIVHLVLARIEGAPAGTKGISLFVVPKFLPDAEGNAGVRNAVSCGSIEEKMGIHANATCVMNYDGATGWLVGERGEGAPRHVHDDERGAARRRGAGARRFRKSPIRTPRLTRASAARGARSPAPRSRPRAPIRSSCIPTCGGC